MKSVIGESFKTHFEHKYTLDLSFLNKDSINNLIILKKKMVAFKGDKLK